ncbi:MAG: glycosyltransferase family 1 protein [Chloroflexi bacterium]|nr:glycosyltransferase family 4 protein [Chloroflexota bacterium]MQC26038.1 glycosyltransferase family 1 protein [Chloroflexota bacterium]
MRILTVLTYYRPHTSGLTIYAERLAKALVQRGHEVTVLTSQFEADLPLEEIRDGVRIRRLPILTRISKGVLIPSFGIVSTQEIRKHDAVLLHLPQFDAAGLALRGRLMKKPTVIIYHSDLTLPPGLFNRLVNLVINSMNHLSAIFTHRISAYTEDFASYSPYLSSYPEKVRVIPPAVELPQTPKEDIRAFAQENNPEQRHPVIAMATRFAAEKGVELLIQALPSILEKHPNAMVWFAGQYKDVLGEEAYLKRLMPTIRQYESQGQWKFLGVLDMQQMANFYPNIDLLVVPSTNSTETFGFVQIEAMMNGKPVVASNLPGVRQPVTMTGMGRVTPLGNAAALAENMLAVLDNPAQFRGDSDALREQFSPAMCAERHEALFKEIANQLVQR